VFARPADGGLRRRPSSFVDSQHRGELIAPRRNGSMSRNTAPSSSLRQRRQAPKGGRTLVPPRNSLLPLVRPRQRLKGQKTTRAPAHWGESDNVSHTTSWGWAHATKNALQPARWKSAEKVSPWRHLRICEHRPIGRSPSSRRTRFRPQSCGTSDDLVPNRLNALKGEESVVHQMGRARRADR